LPFSQMCFLPVSCFAYSLTLKTETICSAGISTDFQWTTWDYIPEDRTLHSHLCENLTPNILNDKIEGQAKTIILETTHVFYKATQNLRHTQIICTVPLRWNNCCGYTFLHDHSSLSRCELGNYIFCIYCICISTCQITYITILLQFCNSLHKLLLW
jgi:hypothetical protein